MFENVQKILENWNVANSERAKLQHVYATLAIIVLLIAGLTSLLNDAYGQQLLVLSFMLTVVFFTNAVAWALLQSFLLQRLHSKKFPTKKKK